MKELINKSEVEVIIHDLEKPLTVEQRCKYLSLMPKLLEPHKDDVKFKNALNSMCNSIFSVFTSNPKIMNYHGESIWSALSFILLNHKKTHYFKSNFFLIELKSKLSQDQVILIESQYKINFNTREIREAMFEKFYDTYTSKINSLKLSNIEIFVDEFHEYIIKNKISDNCVEKLYEKHKNLFLLNLKSFYSMKVSDKNLISTFNSILNTQNTSSEKCELMNNFVELFTETNIFKNSFAPLKAPIPAMLKFFNKQIKKSENLTVAQKKNNQIDVVNRNLIYTNQEVINYFVNHPFIRHSNMQNKIHRHQKIALFNKLKLNDFEQEQLNKINTEKDKINTKKIKI